MHTSDTDYVRMLNISKRFGNVQANSAVNFSVRKGEIHALLGENGSGKSTLMNILDGIYAQDEGTIEIDGHEVKINSPADAIRLGIGMVHQHFKQVDVFTAAENIIGGLARPILLNQQKIYGKIQDLCEHYGLQLDPKKRCYTMSVSEKQTVEIVKVLYHGAKLLILDEPTAVLTPQETDNLFSILRGMRDKGCSIIIITHKLDEVMAISDRVTILRKGHSICTVNTAETSPQQLTEMMVGAKVDLDVPYVMIPEEQKEITLEIKDLTVKGTGDKPKLNQINLDINSHEIFGVAGIAGSGQKELCEAIAGLQLAEGSILLNGQELLNQKPSQQMRKGVTLGFVPEDRLGMGLAGGLNIEDNAVLKSYWRQKGGIVNKKFSEHEANEIIDSYHVSTSGTKQVIRTLSGGNIQKVLLGREIMQKPSPSCLIVAYPVRGLDIAASRFVYEELNRQKEQGVAVLLIGEDLDVLIGLCDRIGVLHDGSLMGIVDAKKTTKEELGWMMLGQKMESINDKGS
jgi:ABC-type uncharacterized transport system ATPase subunit